jgi:hypothetical protein
MCVKTTNDDEAKSEVSSEAEEEDVKAARELGFMRGSN